MSILEGTDLYKHTHMLMCTNHFPFDPIKSFIMDTFFIK